ncbi:MAG: PilZ domain-containing protein [Candidatus Angelobacter sp.]
MDLDATKSPDPGVKQKVEKRRQFVDRAVRRELRIPLRYRRTEQEEWRPGETINVSESGLLFTSNELLDLDARLEITFQTSGPIILQRSTRAATIVRRILSNWPETQVVFGVRYSS